MLLKMLSLGHGFVARESESNRLFKKRVSFESAMILDTSRLPATAYLIRNTLGNNPVRAPGDRTMPNAAALFRSARVFAGRFVPGLQVAGSSYPYPCLARTLRLVRILLTSG